MEHGQERNRHVKRTYTKLNAETTSGKSVSIEYCDSELSVAEKYCKYCDEFVSTESMGIFGFVFCPQCHNNW